jgi:hypothetical protein
MHYGVGVVPARPYKPRDRAKVESGVFSWQSVGSSPLFAIEELNQAIRVIASTSDRFANAKARARRSSPRYTSPR